MEEIEEYIKYGLETQFHYVRRNLNIWKHIADNVSELKKCDNSTRHLFVFAQQAAQTNHTLGICHIYDKPYRNYPTRCLISFFELIRKHKEEIQNKLEPKRVKRIVREMDCEPELKELVEQNPENFVEDFLSYYYDNLFHSKFIQERVDQVKLVRDKYVAHNEAVADVVSIDLNLFEELLVYAEEVSRVYCAVCTDMTFVPKIEDQTAQFMLDAIKKAISK